MNPPTVSLFHRILEYLEEIDRDPEIGSYLAEKAALLVEDIETLLENEDAE